MTSNYNYNCKKLNRTAFCGKCYCVTGMSSVCSTVSVKCANKLTNFLIAAEAKCEYTVKKLKSPTWATSQFFRD